MCACRRHYDSSATCTCRCNHNLNYGRIRTEAHRDNSKLKEDSRKLMFELGLKEFPVVFELYLKAFQIETEIDEAMGRVVSLIRAAPDSETAWQKVCVFLDSLEK